MKDFNLENKATKENIAAVKSFRYRQNVSTIPCSERRYSACKSSARMRRKKILHYLRLQGKISSLHSAN